MNTRVNLNRVVFEKGMIKGRLVRDVNTINNIPIWTLHNKKPNQNLSSSHCHKPDF